MATELQKLQGFLDTKEVEVKVEKDPKLRSLRRVEDVMKLITEGITKEEFLKSFKSVVSIVLKVERDLIAKIQTTTVKLEGNLDLLREDSKKSFGVLEGRLSNSVDSALKEQENGMNFIRDKVRKIKVGEDGHTPTNNELLVLIKPLIPILEIPKVEMPNLERFDEEDERLSGKIEELEDKIEEISKQKRLGGTGGDANVAFSLSRLGTSETPVGSINGSNTTYTISRVPKLILSFFINGMFIHPAEYTQSGTTITFSTALPSSLSGKGFTITFV